MSKVNQKIGVLGGGQLGKMLFQAGLDLDFDLHFLDTDATAPCSVFAKNFSCGNLKDFDAVMAFGADKDLITIEIENVNLDALTALENQGKRVFPQPAVLRIIQDKRTQKQFFVDNGIPTAAFVCVENQADVQQRADFLPAVNKLAKDGYDGKGVQILHTEADMAKAFDAPGLLEKLVPFTKELAVVVGRNEQGDVRCFPTVEMVFHPTANLVEFQFSPAGVSSEIHQKAQKIAENIATKLGIVGTLAVEMFLLPDGEILVNEVAPRVHNSGHQTMKASVTSQFEQHLRAICGLPLGSTESSGFGAMVNLLGHPDHIGKPIYSGLEKILETSGVYPYFYSKKLTKPFRKMGHVSIIDENFENLIKKANFVRETLKVIAETNP